MESLISNSIDALSNFLSGIEVKLKQKNLSSALVSIVVPTGDIYLKGTLNYFTKYFERSFYFEKPDESFRLLGIDEAVSISENGDSRLVVTDKKIKELKNSFINNWEGLTKKELPLFIGGLKFTHEHSEAEWQDFNDSTWYVPEIMLLKNSEGNFLFLNFLSSKTSSKDFIISKFKSKLTKLFSFKPEPDLGRNVKIIKSEGASPKDKKKWKGLVSEALEKIKENQIEKVVLSRKVELKLSGEPNMDYIIENFKKNYSNCYLFIFHRGRSSFFGATPEKLARLTNNKIEIDALAGSAPRGKDEEEDLMNEQNLLKDEKNLNEHNIVIEHIKNSIAGVSSEIKYDTLYGIKKLANIQHLWTRISAELSDSASIFTIIKGLYPTPAICGLPKDAALQMIKKIEGYKRGLYSGIIGWFNFDNEAELVVALRSALYTNNKLLAFAGGGIVEHSDPETEYKETELKLKTIMLLFTDENKN